MTSHRTAAPFTVPHKLGPSLMVTCMCHVDLAIDERETGTVVCGKCGQEWAYKFTDKEFTLTRRPK